MRKFSIQLRNFYFKVGLNTAAPNTILFKIDQAIRKIYFNLQLIRRSFSPHVRREIDRSFDVVSNFSIKKDVKRIVVLKLDHMGDFVVAVDALKMLRDAFPKSEITLICLPFISGLADSTNIFDKVITYEAFPESKKFSIKSKVIPTKKLSDLLDGHYCLAVDMRHDPDTRHYLDEVSADFRAGFFGSCEAKLDIAIPLLEWDLSFDYGDDGYLPIHSSTRLKLLVVAIIDYFKEKNSLDLFGFSTGPLDSKVTPKGAKLKVGVCLGAGAETREWPIEYWADLLRKIKEQNSAFIIFFGDKRDAIATKKLMKILGWSEDDGLNLAGELDLVDLPRLMRDLDIYIGGDTGPTHLAAALGVRTIDIYPGISNFSVWKVKGESICVLQAKVPCAPCHLRSIKDCRYGHRCMKLIEPIHVYDALQRLLD